MNLYTPPRGRACLGVGARAVLVCLYRRLNLNLNFNFSIYAYSNSSEIRLHKIDVKGNVLKYALSYFKHEEETEITLPTVSMFKCGSEINRLTFKSTFQ